VERSDHPMGCGDDKRASLGVLPVLRLKACAKGADLLVTE
jgi:hypothetical protein